VLEKPGITHDRARVKNRLEGKNYVRVPQGHGQWTFHSFIITKNNVCCQSSENGDVRLKRLKIETV
jgi:hypothetical protein